MPIRGSIAVLFFSYSPSRSAREKRYVRVENHNRILHERLYARTLNLVRGLHLDFYLIDENKQKGENFHDRFWGALNTVFQSGYRAVLTIGGDTPTLNASILKGSIRRLRRGQNVLGPTEDGGSYLIGLQRISYSRLRNHRIQWQQGTDFNELRSLLAPDSLWVAPILVDWDSYIDIERSWSRAPLLSIWRILLADLFVVISKSLFLTLCPVPKSLILSAYGLRAPPRV